MNSDEVHVLLLLAHNKSMPPLSGYKNRERPYWDEIESALDDAFEHGGNVRLEVLRPKNAYVNILDMTSLPKQFRIVLLTRDEDPKKELFEWWEPEVTKFRGKIRFGDDYWDARSVCSDLTVAKKIFHDLYEHGELSPETMSMLRSGWDPMPE